MPKNPPPGMPAEEDVQNINETSYVTVNLGQHIIKTTEDKIRLCLNSRIEVLKNAIIVKESWIAPLGVFITILIVFPTTTFKDWLFSSDVWATIFVIGGLTTFIWLVISVKKACSNKSINSSEIINGFITEISSTQYISKTTASQDTTFSEQRNN